MHLNVFNPGYDPYKEYHHPEKIELMTKLKQKLFRLSDTGVNPQIFNQWKREGLVYGVDDGRKWISLDFGQYLWIKLIRDLRAFGVSLTDIKYIKDSLTIDIYQEVLRAIPQEKIKQLEEDLKQVVAVYKETSGDPTPVDPAQDNLLKDWMQKNFNGPGNMIELIVAHMVLSGKDAWLTLVLTHHMAALGFNFQREQRQQQQGTGKRKRALRENLIACFLHTEEFENMNVDAQKVNTIYSTPHMKIPLKQYITEFMAEEKNQDKIEKFALLNKEEQLLLRELRKDNVQEIQIIMDSKKENGKNKIDRIEVTKPYRKKAEARLIETYSKNEYADITYKVNNGEIVSFKKVVKIKL